MIVYASGKMIATDEDGNTQSISVIGAEQDAVKVIDENIHTLLSSILKELKINNLHNSIINDVMIERSDMGV